MSLFYFTFNVSTRTESWRKVSERSSFIDKDDKRKTFPLVIECKQWQKTKDFSLFLVTSFSLFSFLIFLVRKKTFNDYNDNVLTLLFIAFNKFAVTVRVLAMPVAKQQLNRTTFCTLFFRPLLFILCPIHILGTECFVAASLFTFFVSFVVSDLATNSTWIFESLNFFE